MNNIIEIARKYMDGQRMVEMGREVSAFHRIQSSTGFRAAAELCVKWLEEGGIDATILKYKGDAETGDPSSRPMLEWDMRGGRCEIDGFGEIADFEKISTSILCRSIAADFRQDGLEVVYLDKSADENDYEGLDLAQKLIFVRGNMLDYAWAWQKRGARGVITDYVLNAEYHQDVVRYTSFWWNERPDEVKTFGFGLPPSLGRRLAEHCIAASAEGRKVIARGFIDSSLYSGTADTVSAFLPGETDEEILIVAHLCHPQPSANDNTSGVAASISAMLALKRALEAGDLPPLKRGVRLLLVPEMRGTYDYLRDVWPNRQRILAGINLDMVGGRQDGSCGPLVLTMLPLALPSFTEQAAILALERASEGFQGFNPAQKLPSVMNACSVFSGGSDHYILSDPTVGVPTTMLGQWPDRFYHTSGDTWERLCPRVLMASGGAAFGFAAMLASLTPCALEALLAHGRLVLAQRLEALGGENASEMCALLLSAAKSAANDAARFFPGDAKVAELIKKEHTRLESLAHAFCDCCYGGEKPAAADTRVPRRLHPMPVESLEMAAMTAGQLDAYKAYIAARKGGYMAETLACYYMDGARTVSEIIRLAALECGESTETLGDYITLLEKCKLIEF